MQPQTILAVFAHPDDELSAGGILARYAASGANVTLVCVTRGEAGEISDPGRATPETLAEVRTQELLTAEKASGGLRWDTHRERISIVRRFRRFWPAASTLHRAR